MMMMTMIMMMMMMIIIINTYSSLCFHELQCIKRIYNKKKILILLELTITMNIMFFTFKMEPLTVLAEMVEQWNIDYGKVEPR